MPTMERSNHCVLRTHVRPDGKKGVEAHTPEGTLPIHTSEELEAQLKHYAKLLTSLHTVGTAHARRHYVELIRPALRYYCKKFSRELPKWLVNDDYYTEVMPASDRMKLFGTKPLRIGEFQQLKKIQGGSGEALHAPKSGGDDDGGE